MNSIIEYDKPIEVTKKQYSILMVKLSGVVAGREENGKYFVKVWLMGYKHIVEKIIKNN